MSRPFPGRRSHVFARSEDLDSWIRHSAFWRSQDLNLLARIERSRELRAEIQQARQDLHLKMAALRKEIATLRNHRHKRPTG